MPPSGEHDVVLLPDERDEREIERDGGGANGDSEVGDAGGDREGYYEVR
jgi:hypothetical protein